MNCKTCFSIFKTVNRDNDLLMWSQKPIITFLLFNALPISYRFQNGHIHQAISITPYKFLKQIQQDERFDICH